MECPAKDETGAVTVRDPRGQRLKVPCWMLREEAAQVALSTGSVVAVTALLSICSMIEAFQTTQKQS